MSSKFISVVVPTYNRKNSLMECLDSLLAQTYPAKKYEIILVDGSTDNKTEELIKIIYCKKFENIKYIKQNKQGISSARNQGIENAKGEIICFTDDDCVADKNWIINLVEKFSDEKIGCVGGYTRAYKLETLAEKYCEKTNLFSNNSPFLITTCNASYRKDILFKIGRFDECTNLGAEDTDLSMRLLLAGYKILRSNDAIVYHKHRSTVKGLLNQIIYYGFTRTSFLHNKYPKYYHPRDFLIRNLYEISILLLKIPLKLLKSIFNKEDDRLYSIAEPFLGIYYYIAFIIGTLKGVSYPTKVSEVFDVKVSSLPTDREKNIFKAFLNKLNIR